MVFEVLADGLKHAALNPPHHLMLRDAEALHRAAHRISPVRMTVGETVTTLRNSHGAGDLMLQAHMFYIPEKRPVRRLRALPQVRVQVKFGGYDHP